MTEPSTGLRAFRPTLIVLGTIYVLMASFALYQGTAFLEEFGVSTGVRSAMAWSISETA